MVHHILEDVANDLGHALPVGTGGWQGGTCVGDRFREYRTRNPVEECPHVKLLGGAHHRTRVRKCHALPDKRGKPVDLIDDTGR